MADYSVDIKLAVAGAKQLKAARAETTALSKEINTLNKLANKQSKTLPNSFNTLNKVLGQAKGNLNKVALGTERYFRAIGDVIDKEKRGYSGILVGYGHIKSSKLTKQMKGFFSKKSQEPKKILKEFRIENQDQYKPGTEINLNILKDKKFVDVRSKSIGKGFAGSMKRHNFSGLRASHGVSISHRSHGSTGQNQDPGKVFKGKKMAGHMGDKIRTMQNIEIIKSDKDNNLLYLKGSIPGAKNAEVVIKKAVKNLRKLTMSEKIEQIEKMKKSADKKKK